MKINPFTSSSFESIWAKHFNHGKDLEAFDFIKGVKFVKNSRDGIYINAGRNLTKGISYSLDYSKHDYKGKTFLLYDVPAYFDLQEFKPPADSSLKLKTLFQYQGFLMDITNFNDQDEYINSRFSSKNRREFRSNKRRLEQCFDISYSFINEAMSQADFDVLFEQFYQLLSKRFADKQTNYHHLSSNKWNYYRELVFKMLQEQRASLLVIYNETTPIGITLNFHAEDILFETITVFDPDYYKFSIGKTSIIKLLEWCFEHNYRISDFSKGDFDYKHKWSNLVYDFNYHVLYDSKSLKSVVRAKYAETYYRLKLYLRKKKVNELYRKYKFLLKGKEKDTSYQNFKFEKITDFTPSDAYSTIDFRSETYRFLKQFVYTFLFANPESVANIKVFKHNTSNEFVIVGSEKAQKVIFS
ncbi:GNAT family N-acetyltransferase [uncultured Psychroserpens sp.]|uniref:GNAT family N-acetyltransferase n=1 Tax=uncultured Psychroserpens sp. TaxID=255436 RepID=UPI00261C8AEB|nr:GNAT family N-acetyltransferase [uncultured Psychroserpens sp.]